LVRLLDLIDALVDQQKLALVNLLLLLGPCFLLGD